jgi:hypothetical protein
MKTVARALLTLSALALVAGCSDGKDNPFIIAPVDPPGPMEPTEPVAPPPLDCDPLVPSYCGFPYPNNYWTQADDTSPTGMRLALPEVIMPVNVAGVRSQTAAFNEKDGFSPGIAAMTHMPGATVQGLATPDSIEASLEPTSRTIIINAETGERVPHWVDLDEYVVESKRRILDGKPTPNFVIERDLEQLLQEQALMLRPAIRLDDATRYIVAIRGVVDAMGDALEPTAGFLALREAQTPADPILAARQDHFEALFATLASNGIAREDLQLAWDFTTASRENNTQAMLHIRDDALANNPNGVAYRIEERDEGLIDGMACRLEVTFDVPLYMTDGESGAGFNLGEDGMPTQNGTYEYAAALVVPMSAQTEPAPLVAFGHGQLGAKEQVLGAQPLAVTENIALFGLDWKGFSSDDTGTVVGALAGGDLSTFRVVPERMHQGFLNFLVAMRTLSVEADGGPSTALNEALNTFCGGAMLDGSKRYYFGGSQGGILGASLMAISTDMQRGLLAVPGQSYNLLLNRSVNFDPFAATIYAGYDWHGLDMQLNLALVQGLWDTAEPTGYSRYIRTDTLPGTPSHEVLIQVSKADHQVTNLGAHIMARTIGGVVNLAPTIRDVWGLEVVSGEHSGSAMLEIDFGNDEPPITNIPHWDDEFPDPHGRATELIGIGGLLRQFYDTGVAQNPCTGACDDDDIL